MHLFELFNATRNLQLLQLLFQFLNLSLQIRSCFFQHFNLVLQLWLSGLWQQLLLRSSVLLYTRKWAQERSKQCVLQKCMCTCVLKACTSRCLRLVFSSCCCLSTSRLAFSLVVRATLSMKRLATFCSRSFTLSSSSITLDCNSSGASTSLPSGGMAASSDCTCEQKRHL